MTDFFGAFSLPVTVSISTAGAKTTTSSFSRNVSFSSRFAAHTNALRLNAGTPGTFGFTVDAPGRLISGTNPAKALKANGSVADALVSLTLASPQSELWLSYQLGLPQAAIDGFTEPGSGAGVFLDDLASETSTFAINDPVTFGAVWTGFWGGAGSIPAPTDVWQLVERHFVNGTLSEAYIGGVRVWTETPPASNIDAFSLGLIACVPHAAGSVVYFSDVKVGTVRGGSDLFSDDFSDGTLDAWTNTDGDVSVVAPPGSLVASLTPNIPGNLVLS